MATATTASGGQVAPQPFDRHGGVAETSSASVSYSRRWLRLRELERPDADFDAFPESDVAPGQGWGPNCVVGVPR